AVLRNSGPMMGWLMRSADCHRPRVLFLQFTNPAGYPPLEHASRILARLGWDVLFLGTGAYGADSLRFPGDPAIRERRMPALRPGMLQKPAYVAYTAWAVATCAVWRPRWIYASDPTAALPALLGRLALRFHIVYHEHDSPTWPGRIELMQRL